MLATARLLLRRFVPADVPALIAYRADPGVARYQEWSDFTEADALALIDGHSGWTQIAVTLASDGTLAGDVGVCITNDRAEIGFTFAPAHQGNGYASEAVAAVIELLRETGVRELRAIVDTRNAPAIALVRRLGMSLQSVERAEFKGAQCDEAHYALLL